MATKSAFFTTNAWQPDTNSGKLAMTLSASDLGLGGGTNLRLSKLQKTVNGNYENVVSSYKVTLDGSMIVYSDEAFVGRYTVSSD